MSNLNSTKSKHLTQDERLEIQQCLDHGVTFKAIAKRIGKDPTTISKEVKKHFTVIASTVVKNIDRDGNSITVPCPSLLKAPFVCNTCKKRHQPCGFQKQLYNANNAHKDYKSLLSEAREGIPLNKDEFYEIDNIISDGIRKGQHLYHIMKTNNLKVSTSSVYRHLHRGYLSVAAIDFPRVVKFKPRKHRYLDYVPKTIRIGRSHEDFLSHIEENNISSWVELDTVVGQIGGKAIMTLDFTFCNFILGFLLEHKSSSEVSEKITLLKSTLSENQLRFGDIFPLILTDNGGEFSNVSVFEKNLYGEHEASLFFCDPYKSYQKPYVEKNHTLLRDIVPKSTSFDIFTQSTINIIFSHINSVKRKNLNGKTPYEIFSFTYSTFISNIFGIEFIPADMVIQSPKLLEQLTLKRLCFRLVCYAILYLFALFFYFCFFFRCCFFQFTILNSVDFSY